jgi:TonB family protein
VANEVPHFDRRPDRRAARAAVAVGVSVLVHLLLLGALWVMSLLGWLTPPERPVQEPVALVDLSSAQWDQNRLSGPDAKNKQAPSTSPKSTEPKKKEEKKDEPLPKGQVVAVAPGNKEKPKDSRFLAEDDNTVDKETRAKDTTAFYKNAQSHKTTTAPPTETQGHDPGDKVQVQGNQGVANDERERKEGKKSAGHFEVPTAQQKTALAVADKGPGGELHNQAEVEAVKGNSDRLQLTPGELGGPGEASDASPGKLGSRNVLNLMPSQATLDKITGAAANDHLDDVDEGQGTFLNTREFKYASFFNRVKQRVGEVWNPGDPLRRRDPEGRIYAYKDRYTVLNVVLDKRGSLTGVTIERSCGVDFLDQEAVAAFERAQPFPNPPPGLVGSAGDVRFNFAFFLEVNPASSLKVFRARD